MARMTTESFIKRAKEIHGDKYIYTETDLLHRDEKGRVKIICPIHGEFWQFPSNHLCGKGCRKCGDMLKSQKFAKKTENFIEEANKVHNNKYIYTETRYINNRTPVCIICPIHGEFWQLPTNHLKGHGCSKCNEISKLEQDIEDFLNENDISYQMQKRFEWLGSQSLDFYLPKYNIGIECQGIQHFQIRDFSGHNFEQAKLNFEIQKERDSKKFELCKANNVKLLYYSNLGIEYPYQVYENKKELLKEIKK